MCRDRYRYIWPFVVCCTLYNLAMLHNRCVRLQIAKACVLVSISQPSRPVPASAAEQCFSGTTAFELLLAAVWWRHSSDDGHSALRPSAARDQRSDVEATRTTRSVSSVHPQSPCLHCSRFGHPAFSLSASFAAVTCQLSGICHGNQRWMGGWRWCRYHLVISGAVMFVRISPACWLWACQQHFWEST